MSPTDRSRITQILIESRANDASTSARLAEALYPELRRLAASLMRRERRHHTLQPTALVSEAFVRLVDQTSIAWTDRAHFLGVAARVMRQVLVDHARRHAAAKRGGHLKQVTLDDRVGGGQHPVDILVVNDALDRLAANDPRAARVVEMRVFGGLTVEEVAAVVGTSARTVDGDWRVARLWLARELGGPSPAP
jgi:RNA polymerase sigma factor (TIGR02999 family)